jgi:uncharacterized repeat protein (TIGR01451 family)
VVDQLASEYAAAGQPVLFLEQDVDQPLGSRVDRWWAAHGAGSVSLPLSMVDSGHQIDNGYTDATSTYNTYKAMVDAALARPALAEIVAHSQRSGERLHFDVQLTNRSGVTLSASNSATVHAIVYEEHTPLDPNVDHITGRIVRAAVSTGISPALSDGATMTLTLESAELNNVADWDKVHTLVLADYRPGGTSGAYDMLQAAVADAADAEAALTVSKQVAPDPVQPGAPLTYTIRVANTGDVALHATVTDTLPLHVAYAGPLVWTPTITTPGGVWEQTFVVTVEAGYSGTLVNTVQVTTDEGASGVGLAISNGGRVYLPLVVKD